VVFEKEYIVRYSSAELLSSSAEVKNGWSHASTPRISYLCIRHGELSYCCCLIVFIIFNVTRIDNLPRYFASYCSWCGYWFCRKVLLSVPPQKFVLTPVLILGNKNFKFRVSFSGLTYVSNFIEIRLATFELKFEGGRKDVQTDGHRDKWFSYLCVLLLRALQLAGVRTCLSLSRVKYRMFLKVLLLRFSQLEGLRTFVSLNGVKYRIFLKVLLRAFKLVWGYVYHWAE
jgi:hypothetical protein